MNTIYHQAARFYLTQKNGSVKQCANQFNIEIRKLRNLLKLCQKDIRQLKNIYL